jgi:hypothetical protein
MESKIIQKQNPIELLKRSKDQEVILEDKIFNYFSLAGEDDNVETHIQAQKEVL